MRILVILLIALVPCWLPLAVIADITAGVDGFEMRQLNDQADWPRLAEANAPATTRDWLNDVYGTPAAGDQLARFVFVPAERIVATPEGHTLIRLDRSQGEWLMEARTLRNLAGLATAANVAAAIVGGVGLILVRRRQRRSAAAGRATESSQSQM